MGIYWVTWGGRTYRHIQANKSFVFHFNGHKTAVCVFCNSCTTKNQKFAVVMKSMRPSISLGKTREQDGRTANVWGVSDKAIKCRHFSEVYLPSSEQPESRDQLADLPQSFLWQDFQCLPVPGSLIGSYNLGFILSL